MALPPGEVKYTRAKRKDKPSGIESEAKVWAMTTADQLAIVNKLLQVHICLLSQHINPRTNTLTNQKAGYLRSYFNFLSCSKAPEEAHALAQAGLVVDWVKSKRLLVLVRCLRY